MNKEKKVVTENVRQKLLVYAHEMFEQNKSNRDYPFKTMEQQYDEMVEGYENGWLTDKFIDFATS